jgi:hypothetical protein
MPIHSPGYWSNERLKDLFCLQENPEVTDLLHGTYVHYDELQATALLDSKYEKQDVHAVATSQKNLTPDQRLQLEQLLLKQDCLLSGRLGVWKDQIINVDLHPDV